MDKTCGDIEVGCYNAATTYIVVRTQIIDSLIRSNYYPPTDDQTANFPLEFSNGPQWMPIEKWHARLAPT